MLVKDNHPILHKKLRAFFTGSCLFGAAFESALSTDSGHGRVEKRRIQVSSDLPPGYTGFAEVRQVFCLTRTVITKKSGEIREESVYGMTSLPASKADPKCLLELNRSHWHIENKSHWVRDVTFDEDRSQVRKGNIPQVMAALRNVCIGLMRVKGYPNIASACRHFAAKPRAALQLIGILEN